MKAGSQAPLGVITPMTVEARCVAGVSVAPGDTYRVGFGGVGICSGMGPDHAERATRRLLETGVSALLVAGFAGGLVPGTTSGQQIIPEVVIIGAERFETDPGLREGLRRLTHDRSGDAAVLASVPRPVSGAGAKTALSAATGAQAVDMESGAVGRVARNAGLPFAVIRVVLDPVDLGLPAATRSVDPFGRPLPLAFAVALAGAPAEWMSFVRMMRCYRAARRELARVGEELRSAEEGWLA